MAELRKSLLARAAALVALSKAAIALSRRRMNDSPVSAGGGTEAPGYANLAEWDARDRPPAEVNDVPEGGSGA